MAEEALETTVADVPAQEQTPVVEPAAVETPSTHVERPTHERKEREAREYPRADTDALAAKIGDKFAEAFKNDGDGDEEVTDEIEKPVSADVEKPAETETKEETTPEAGKEAAVPSGAPTLPASYRRSLKAYEWTDEEIDANLKALGPAFIQSAAKIHATRSREIAQWAEMGRQARVNTPAPQAAQKPITEEAALQPLDPKALKAKYGDEKFIDDIAGPINQTIDRINKMLPTIQQTQRSAQQAQLETLDRQVQAFFNGKELEPYQGVYGKGEKITDDHFKTRQKVLETADALIGGARMQGRNLSLDEALTLAHDSVTAPIKAQAAKKELADTLTQRNKAITMRPNTRGPAAGSEAQGIAKNRTELESRVKQRLSKVFV